MSEIRQTRKLPLFGRLKNLFHLFRPVPFPNGTGFIHDKNVKKGDLFTCSGKKRHPENIFPYTGAFMKAGLCYILLVN